MTKPSTRLSPPKTRKRSRQSRSGSCPSANRYSPAATPRTGTTLLPACRGSTPPTAPASPSSSPCWTCSAADYSGVGQQVIAAGEVVAGQQVRNHRLGDGGLGGCCQVAFLDEFLEPEVGGLGRALQCFEVNVQQAERLLIARGPFEVVQERPHVVAAQVHGLGDPTGGRGPQRGFKVVGDVLQPAFIRDEPG